MTSSGSRTATAAPASSGIVVRPGRPEDEEAARRAFQAAGEAAWRDFMPMMPANLGPPRWTDAFEGTGPERVIVAEADAEVVGFAVLRPSGDFDARPSTGELDGFYTHPNVWGLGAGRELMTGVLAWLRESGFADATLWTERRNERPRRIYERAGWHTDGTVRYRVVWGTDLVELRYRIRVA